MPTLAPRTVLAKRALSKSAKLATPTAKSKTTLAKTRRVRQALLRKRKGVTGNTTKATSATSAANASDSEDGDGGNSSEGQLGWKVRWGSFRKLGGYLILGYL